MIAIAFSRNPTKRLPVPSRSRRSISGRIGIAPRPALGPRTGDGGVAPLARVRPWHPPCPADTIAASEPVSAPRAPLGRSLSRPPRPPRALWADVAQLVEQLIRNQQVAGSNPAVGSIRFAFEIS